MVSFKNTKRLLYCTPADVRLSTRLLARRDMKLTDANLILIDDPFNEDVINDAEIEQFILMTDGMIRMRLSHLYVEADFKLSTPIWGMPVPAYKNTVKPSQLRLQGVAIANAAITEQWTLVFDIAQTDGTLDYSVWGSFSGFQGIGKLDDGLVPPYVFTATDGDLIISDASWFRNPIDIQAGANDKIFLSTYNIDPRIVYISSRITAADVLRSLLSDQLPNYSAFIDKIEQDAKKLLDQLAKGEIALSVAAGEVDPDTHGYYVNDFGVMQSKRLVISGAEPENFGGVTFDFSERSW